MLQKPCLTSLRRSYLDTYYRLDESQAVEDLLQTLNVPEAMNRRIRARADLLVTQVHQNQSQESSVDTFMHQYDLSTPEGLLFMGMAEALLRIPDKETILTLLQDKLSQAHFEPYYQASASRLVNWATWWLDLAKDLVEEDASPQRKGEEKETGRDPGKALLKFFKKASRPVIREASLRAMQVLGQNIPA